jgi:hypothetical protein
MVKLFFRALFTLLVVAVFVVLFWRMSSSRVPKELVTLTPNEVLLEAYEEHGDGLFKLTQEQNSITRNEENYGYFAVSSAIFVPKAEQLQLLVRYNDSTLKALQADYALDFLPESDKDWYDVTLVLAIDKTPENEDDNLANDPASVELVRVKASELAARAHSGRHSYRKFIFDGVKFDGKLLAVYADFYYVGDLAYENEDFDIYTDKAYGTLCLYAYTEDAINKETPLTEEDRAALEARK